MPGLSNIFGGSDTGSDNGGSSVLGVDLPDFDTNESGNGQPDDGGTGNGSDGNDVGVDNGVGLTPVDPEPQPETLIIDG